MFKVATPESTKFLKTKKPYQT